MIKRILCAILCLLLLLGLAAPAFAAETKQKPEGEEAPAEARTLSIGNVWELKRFAEKARLDSYSRNLTVELTRDLDLTGEDFAGIPIFCGTFQGNGHTISGFTLTEDGSNLGLFRYLTDTAVVSDLNLKADISPEGIRENIGGIAGHNAGRIENCSFDGSVSGGEATGGIAGTNALSGIIEHCRTRGSVNGSHFVGGMAGKNQGVIRECTNTARINTTAQENTVSLEDITIGTMLSSESSATVTDIGGIAGNSTGVIRACVNRGDVGYPHMGYNIGGIAGTQAGYIQGCRNLGDIQGRKEIGGIVGQQEPSALIEYDEDALQILKRQLTGMGSLVNKTASNVQNAGEELYGQVYDLQDQIYGAQESIGLLIPDLSDPQLPDEDTIQAAKNGLSSSISGMSNTLGGMQATVESAVGKLSNNLHALQGQMNAMSATLGNAEETLGGSITDVSDADTGVEHTGKIESCTNSGAVLADINAGGIAGAIAMENDLDIREDLDFLGSSSLNFESRLRAVILDCENTGDVTVGKRAGGGIAGWQNLGLVKNCRNTGDVHGAGAEYIGGICGQSSGYIRASHAKCILNGTSHVGGIGGSGAVVTDCRALVLLEGQGQLRGAILGGREKHNLEEENPICGNCYLPAGNDPGGIDGISYDGQAQSMNKTAFLALEGLPAQFRSTTVTFRLAKGSTKTIRLETGSALAATQIPQPLEKEGSTGRWEGLEEADLKNVYLDMTFEAVYTTHPTVIESRDKTKAGRPILLLQGSFPENAVLTLGEAQGPELANGETLLSVWRPELEDGAILTAARLVLPEGSGDAIRVMLLCNGTWQEAGHSLDGSYAVIPMDTLPEAMAVIGLPEENYLPWIIAGAGGLLLVLGLLRKKKK